MSTSIRFEQLARRELRALPQPVAYQILLTIGRFLESGEGDVRPLRGFHPPQYRLRAQNHRVIFRYENESILVLRVRDRKEAYR